MYKFNPISDISLFKNIQTQHFYAKEDINKKKKKLFNIFIGLKMKQLN